MLLKFGFAESTLIDAKLWHPTNVNSPMLITLAGIVTLARYEHDAKALPTTKATVPGIA
jgi:hypothetical protein